MKNNKIDAVKESKRIVIVGAGMAGLTLANLLVKADINVTVIDGRLKPATHPKGRFVTKESMNNFSEIGVAAGIRHREVPPVFGRVNWLGNEGIYGAVSASVASKEKEQDFSGEKNCFVSQDVVEGELIKKMAGNECCNLQSGKKLLDFKDTAEGYVCRILDVRTKVEEELICDYLIGCDGTTSGVRKQLGVDESSKKSIGHFRNILFTAPVLELLREDIKAMINFTPVGNLFAVDLTRWILSFRLQGPGAKYTSEMAAAAVRKYFKKPGLGVEDIHVLQWEMGAFNSDTYSVNSSHSPDRAVCLAGDAAYYFPPIGGMGANCAGEDAYCLASVLIPILKGEADSASLQSYFDQRHPVAERMTKWVLTHMHRMRQMNIASAAGNLEEFQKWAQKPGPYVYGINQKTGIPNSPQAEKESTNKIRLLEGATSNKEMSQHGEGKQGGPACSQL